MVSLCLPSDALSQHLPSYLGFSYLGHGVSLHGCSGKVQPLLLTLDEGCLLTDAKAETPILWPPDVKSWLTGKDWCWGGLGAGGEGDDRGWDGWMASQTRWTWVWMNSRSWWWTGRPGVLQFMGSQRVGHDWATKLKWTTHVVGELAPFYRWRTWGSAN